MTVINHYEYHHLPAESSWLDLDSMSIPDALRVLRDRGRSWFGDMGGMIAELSDGTTLVVELLHASDGGELLSSQRIVRREYVGGRDRLIRVYPWTTTSV